MWPRKYAQLLEWSRRDQMFIAASIRAILECACFHRQNRWKHATPSGSKNQTNRYAINIRPLQGRTANRFTFYTHSASQDFLKSDYASSVTPKICAAMGMIPKGSHVYSNKLHEAITTLKGSHVFFLIQAKCASLAPLRSYWNDPEGIKCLLLLPSGLF